MPVPGEPYDDALLPLHEHAMAALPPGTRWFDAHTHIGHNDPDGLTATAQELQAGLDRAGHHRALAFPMHEPGGYRAANDEVLRAAAASKGRLVALVRVDPKADGALAEARRGLEAGAAGVKLHPRSDAFGLPHPVVEELVAVAAKGGHIVLLHAGRGIPCLGEATVDLAARHPRAQLVLAHAGISDLGLLASAAAELPNLFFDTSWWQADDLVQLFATIPPGRILHASDMPYGGGRMATVTTVRPALEAGLGPDALAAIAGGQLERILAGEAPLDLGPPPGPPPAPRIEARRALAYLTAATQMAFLQADPDEALALARLACQHVDDDPVLDAVDGFCAAAQRALTSREPDPEQERWPGIHELLGAQLVAGTPRAGLPA
ncbi:MAG TPA: amidohydrolase family protein [Solirubrobacteraceae bacterium]|nr:amidohydrolase family protein [Solirubrobacteraceae bacterium]